MNRRLGVAALAALLIPLAGCATETSSANPKAEPTGSPSQSEAPDVPKRLDCRGGGAVGTAGDLMEAGATPKGFETPEQAVEGFLSSMELGGHDYVVDIPRGAWLLRADGSAMGRVDFLLGDGWLVHGYRLCI